MKISELQELLWKVKKTYGDVEIVASDYGSNETYEIKPWLSEVKVSGVRYTAAILVSKEKT